MDIQPFPIGYTAEGFIVMSNSLITDYFGFVIGELTFDSIPLPYQNGMQQSNLSIYDKNFNRRFSNLIYSSTDDIIEKEHVPFDIILSKEHPGVMFAEDILV